MPTLPLPPWSQAPHGVRIDSGDLPVTDAADVLATYSGDLASLPSDPGRDAIVDGQLAAQLTYQSATGYAAAQSDSLRATGEYLDEIGSFERGVQRATGESDEDYRARVNAVPAPVDPNDILAAANAALAPYTDVPCRYAEVSDGVFPGSPEDAVIFEGTPYKRTTAATSFSAHVFADERTSGSDSTGQPFFDPATIGGPVGTPNYPDRLYVAIPNRCPPGVMPCGGASGWSFADPVTGAPFVSTQGPTGWSGPPCLWPIATGPVAAPSQVVGTCAVATTGTYDAPPSLVGSGTAWLTSMQPGQWLQITDGVGFAFIQVIGVASDTSLTFSVYNGSAGGDAQWLGATEDVASDLSLYCATMSSQVQADAAASWFLLRVPDISQVDQNINAVYQYGLGTEPFPAPIAIDLVQDDSGVFRITTTTAHGMVVGQGMTFFGTGVASLDTWSDGLVVTDVLSSTQFRIAQAYVSGYVSGGCVQPGTLDTPESTLDNAGCFPGDPTDPSDDFTATYVYAASDQSSEGAYHALIDAVEKIRGHGIRWAMISDPYLTK